MEPKAEPCFATGEWVRVTLNGTIYRAVVLLASENGRSLILASDSIDHPFRTSAGIYILGVMPVFLHDDKQFHELANNEIVAIARESSQ